MTATREQPGPRPGPQALRDINRWRGNEDCPLIDPARLKAVQDVVRGKVARAAKRPYTKRAA